MRTHDADAGPRDAPAIPAALDAACHLNALLADVDPGALPGALDRLAGLGYRRVVLPPVDPEALDASALAACCAERGIVPIPIAGQEPGADVSSEEPEERRAGAAALRRMIDLTVRLGGDQLNGVPYGLFARADRAAPPAAVARAAAAVGEAAEYAHERGVTLTFEVLNRYETAVVNTAEQAMAFAEASGSPHLGIHLDAFHMLVEEADIAAAIRTALPRLRFLELGQSGRGRLATGALDLPALVADALDAGYGGRWGVEAFSAPLLTAPARAALAVWRAPFSDGPALAAEAAGILRGGYLRHTERRAERAAPGAAAPAAATGPGIPSTDPEHLSEHRP
ncbi:sugar phosphate isomerase/epimerase [Leucobacter allii]|uniref:sugar phosphate isomerase/epimerase family protein n=1 Tax=Leucobacter allii TaxID=2932247 RepID=UPI001FD47014|nr:TIM barrel protein [Leucobacter allii]UOR01844.1 sugar phosphate isomerase/epimerase [Leucobacter allii]